jgi:hypothetical protein
MVLSLVRRVEERERPIPDQIVRKTEYVYPESRERTGSGWSQALSKLAVAWSRLSSASEHWQLNGESKMPVTVMVMAEPECDINETITMTIGLGDQNIYFTSCVPRSLLNPVLAL